MALRLGMQHWGREPCQNCSNYDSGLTLAYFTARLNLIPYAVICQKILKCSFSITIKAKMVIPAMYV